MLLFSFNEFFSEFKEVMVFCWETIIAITPGLKYTVGLFIITLIGSIPLGLILTFAKTSKSKILSSIVHAYVFVMRGTPLMLQLFFFYFGLPVIPFIGKYLVMERFVAACVTFTLNYAAYFCEIFRGGLLSIDKGQYEAAKVLGIGKFKTTIHIIIPQMIKVVLPSVSNEAITLVKDTALVTAIAVVDMMHLTKARVSSTSNIMPFAVAAVFYLVMTYGLTKLTQWLEKKYKF